MQCLFTNATMSSYLLLIFFYTSAVKSTKFHLIILFQVPFYSCTKTRWNQIDGETYFLVVEIDFPTGYSLFPEKSWMSKADSI